MMGVEKPWQNHEGYTDFTAYLALKNIGDKAMTGWNAGDIIRIRIQDGRDVYRIVLKVFEKYAATINLYDSESCENEYAVKADGKELHADLGKIGFTRLFEMERAQFVEGMDEKKLTALLRKVGRTFGIPVWSAQDPSGRAEYERLEALAASAAEKAEERAAECIRLAKKNAALEMEKEELAKAGNAAQEMGASFASMEAELAEAKAELSRVSGDMSALREALIRAEAQRDVFKGLYSDLVARG